MQNYNINPILKDKLGHGRRRDKRFHVAGFAHAHERVLDGSPGCRSATARWQGGQPTGRSSAASSVARRLRATADDETAR
jgi:hypothetical protein